MALRHIPITRNPFHIMPKRTSVKTYKPRTKKGWPSKTRTYPWRAGGPRPAVLALGGIKAGLTNPSSVHRFTRWSSTMVLDLAPPVAGVYAPRVSNQDALLGTTYPFTLSSASGPNLPSGTGENWGGSIKFQLSDLPKYTDFTSLFDHYTIEQVDIEMDLIQNSANLNHGGVGGTMPSITYVPDFDDNNVPADGSALSQYQRSRTFTFRGSGKPLKFSIKPRVATTVYRTAITSAYAAGAENTPLNLTYTDVPHYGVKFWFDNWPVSADGTIGAQLRVRMRYHLKLQDPQ